MSFFRVPSLTIRRPPGVKLVSWSDLRLERKLGEGGYSSVTLYRNREGDDIAVKVFKDSCAYKLIFKEASILNQLHHPNIPQLLGLSDKDPIAMMLEYISFDLRPLGINRSVSSLDGLLTYFDNADFVGLEHTPLSIMAGLVNGLAYLHENGIAHRDLKPQNVLVCNGNDWLLNPVEVKLTDFGESRSLLIQTQTMIESVTNNTYRGTPCFMAPEILKRKHSTMSYFNASTFTDLKSMDIWSLSMVFHMLLSPDLNTPYEIDLKDTVCFEINYIERFILIHLEQNGLPNLSQKYAAMRQAQWKALHDLYKFCAIADAGARPDIVSIQRLVNSSL